MAGSVEAFVEQMNKRAKELGMNETHFVTCNGLDADGHAMSAYDIALMSRELLKHPDIMQFTTIWMDSLRDGKFTLANTNKLIRFYDGATGLKTGSTSIAKNCISATAMRDGMHLIAVVMGAPTSKDRFSDASKLLNFGFGAYAVKKVVSKGEVLADAKVEKSDEKTVPIAAKEDYAYLTKKADSVEIEKKLTLSPSYTAPLAAGEVAGKVEFYAGEKLLGSVDAVFAADVAKKKLFPTYWNILRRWMGEK